MRHFGQIVLGGLVAQLLGQADDGVAAGVARMDRWRCLIRAKRGGRSGGGLVVRWVRRHDGHFLWRNRTIAAAGRLMVMVEMLLLLLLLLKFALVRVLNGGGAAAPHGRSVTVPVIVRCQR